MSLAADMQSLASSLLTEFGQSVTFTRTTEGPFNPSTGGVMGDSYTSFTAVGHPRTYTIDEIDNTTIFKGDIEFVCYTTTEPLVGDVCILDTISYRVNFVEKKNLTAQNIVYRLQLHV